MATKFIGQALKRREDPRLITGLSQYVDDIKLNGMLYAAILRSMYAHAKISSIDVSEAKKLPGVVAVYTGADVKDAIGMVPVAGQLPDLKVPAHYVLAVDRVRYVGEPVAVVVATDRYVARDALDLINVDYDPLPVVVDIEKALEKDSPVIYEEWNSNVAFTWKLEGGDVAKSFKEADTVIKERIENPRVIPSAMEGRAVLADYLPGKGELTLWTSTQIPHLLRTQVALQLGIPENRLRVIAPEVGGGFGSKLNVYAEEALIAALSMRLGKPVKWAESRRENFLNTIHGRGQVDYVEVAVKKDGTVLGIKCKVLQDVGAYHQLLTPAIATLTGLMIAGPYKMQSARVEVIGIFTNKMATDAYRGAGRPEATYLLERMMDMIAAELKLDPTEVRLKNFPGPEEFPFTTATSLTYDSGNYAEPLKKALEMVDYKKLREEQKKLWAEGKYRGIGISTYVEICALGPSPAMAAGGWESATVRVEPSGAVTVLTGASPHGQGQETSFAQIVADEFGIPLEHISVIHGDTSIVQYGIGTFGSRATAVGGTAVWEAVQRVKQKAHKFAAHALKAAPDDVIFEGGKYSVRGGAKEPLTFQQVAMIAYMAKTLPPDTEPGLEATYRYEPANFTFPFGTHIAVVDVDKETGTINIVRYVAVDDCGKAINPMMIDGQVHGGIVQALGQALMEEAVYDENGQLLTGEFMDYALPRASDVPWLETARTETPSPVNPLGIKGVGEAGTIGATPAIVNAVVDALSPLGLRHIDMPLKPEKIWRLFQKK